eukprot:3625928-Rhodomonas_salina.2
MPVWAPDLDDVSFLDVWRWRETVLEEQEELHSRRKLPDHADACQQRGVGAEAEQRCQGAKGLGVGRAE